MNLILYRGFKKLFAVLFPAFLTLNLHLDQIHKRQISKECCALKGGFQCGKLQIDCCVVPQNTPQQKVNSDLCVTGGVLGTSQFCPGQKITEECQYCHKFCENSKGIMCGLSSTGSDQCCARQNCILDISLNLKMKKCKPGTEIKLPDCVNDMDFGDEVLGKLENVI